MRLVLREMTSADLWLIDALERKIFPDPWPLAAFEEHLDEVDTGGLVAEHRGRIVGYVCYRFDCGDAHLTNLAVDPAYRRKSVAKELLDYILDIALKRECELIFLEVRISNEIARKVYEVAGFATVDRCTSYYDNPAEDALVMSRWVSKTPDGN